MQKFHVFSHAHIPHVAKSCDGEMVCKNVGNQGLVGDFENSCKGLHGCYHLARQGVIGNIKDSCLGEYACENLAEEAGKVGNIEGSCNDDYACYALAKDGGKVGMIKDSCKGGKYACKELANDGGHVGNIEACEFAGAGVLNTNYDSNEYVYVGFGDGPILSNLNSCCNTGMNASWPTRQSFQQTAIMVMVVSRARLVRSVRF
jgi:hypothetical protein